MRKTLLFNRSSFEQLLTMEDYITAVEQAHQLHAEGKVIATNLIHADAPNGEYHIKTGGLLGEEQSYYGLKANGGFFMNRERHNLPNILGIIYLSDAATAYPLAVFESSLISKMRTAAATAVAAKYLKPEGAVELGVIGYGNQAEAQIEALLCVLNIDKIRISGRNMDKAALFVEKMQSKIGISIKIEPIEVTCRNSNVLITCTPSTTAMVKSEWIAPGTFIGAIGADSPGKQELEPKLMARAKIVGDIRQQIIKVGEAQHAVKEGLINASDIYGELGALITGKLKGRSHADEIFVYDSTGTAIQDVAAAAYVYEKLKNDPSIPHIDLFS